MTSIILRTNGLNLNRLPVSSICIDLFVKGHHLCFFQSICKSSIFSLKDNKYVLMDLKHVVGHLSTWFPTILRLNIALHFIVCSWSWKKKMRFMVSYIIIFLFGTSAIMQHLVLRVKRNVTQFDFWCDFEVSYLHF